MPREEHWNNVYGTKADDQLSWHQDEPGTSLRLIRRHARGGAGVIDIGGGTSLLASHLVNSGFSPVAVLDISETALPKARERVGQPLADAIAWIVADVTKAPEVGRYDLWHDRAVFHFLTEPSDRRDYMALLSRTVPPGGHAIIAAFGPEGPEQCSGLPVCRYGRNELRSEMPEDFKLTEDLIEPHITPWRKPQEFYYAVYQRAGA